MRKQLFRKAIVVVGLAASVMGAHTQPATAVGAGTGVVTGAVTVTPGVDMSMNDNSFVFNDTIITGALVVGGAPFVGEIDVPTITGGSVDETSVQGSGTVNEFTATGDMEVDGVIEKHLSVTLRGEFTRVGTTVVVTLDGHATLDCVVPDAGTFESDVTVVIVAEFVPTAGNGASGNDPEIPGGEPVTAATFAGAFVAAGT